MDKDFVAVDKPNNAGSKHMTVIPAKNGIYVFKARARAVGNGQPSPSMWLQIIVNGTTLKSTGDVGWIDGANEIELSAAEPVIEGSIYDVMALSGNRNADAQGVELEGQRA